MRKTAFTLVELIVVVIIIGILATIAIPQYLRAVERAKFGKVRSNLKVLSQAEKMYIADHDGTCMPDYQNGLDGYLEPGVFYSMRYGGSQFDPDWNYSQVNCGASGSSNYTIDVDRRGGIYQGTRVTMNQDGALSGTYCDASGFCR